MFLLPTTDVLTNASTNILLHHVCFTVC